MCMLMDEEVGAVALCLLQASVVIVVLLVGGLAYYLYDIKTFKVRQGACSLHLPTQSCPGACMEHDRGSMLIL